MLTKLRAVVWENVIVLVSALQNFGDKFIKYEVLELRKNMKTFPYRRNIFFFGRETWFVTWGPYSGVLQGTDDFLSECVEREAPHNFIISFFTSVC
jgi:hypothetical protein